LKRSRPQPAARALGTSENFYFFNRNPLKRLNSEKQMKANASNFAFIYLHLLKSNSTLGCINPSVPIDRRSPMA